MKFIKQHNDVLILKGNKIRHLIKIFNLTEDNYLDCIYINKDFTSYFSANRKLINRNKSYREYRITKKDIQQIKIIYDITNDLETSLNYLFK